MIFSRMPLRLTSGSGRRSQSSNARRSKQVQVAGDLHGGAADLGHTAQPGAILEALKARIARVVQHDHFPVQD